MTENDRKYYRERLNTMASLYDRAAESPKGTNPTVLAWMRETWLVLADIVRMLDEEDKDGH